MSCSLTDDRATKPIAVAVHNEESQPQFDHAVTITSPNDTIHLITAVSSDSQQAASRADSVLQFFANQCKERQRKCELHALVYNRYAGTISRSSRVEVAESLCVGAQAVGAETLVLGWNSDLSHFNRLALGSVSAHVAYNCPCSTAIIR